MGHWEAELTPRCADCRAPLRVRTQTAKNKRIDQPLHYYAVGEGTSRRMICPACWTTARTAPSLTQGATAVG